MDTKDLEVIRAERNAYMRNYRKANKDKVKNINNTYWMRKATERSKKPQEAE